MPGSETGKNYPFPGKKFEKKTFSLPVSRGKRDSRWSLLSLTIVAKFDSTNDPKGKKEKNTKSCKFVWLSNSKSALTSQERLGDK